MEDNDAMIEVSVSRGLCVIVGMISFGVFCHVVVWVNDVWRRAVPAHGSAIDCGEDGRSIV
jgi:hypothetical protein